MDISTFIPITKFIAIVWPTLYAGTTLQCFTVSDSITFVEPIITHAPNEKVMAKQWLHGYQYGPLWVPPLIGPGTLANLFLAYTARSQTQRIAYIVAALCIFSILPITFFYMEPGINGATKWKVQMLLKDEGFGMKDTTVWYPSAHRQGGTLASRRWAERTGIRELILFWRRVNNWRWGIAFVAAVASGWATFGEVA
ncbi:hypothetical protein LTR91_009382 [Friedmanniomyces endolithicus]|uniref:Uncharacterized protein n=1 Tax=Friedmanniomyces endolithicus TaxID=329885 RepID=A0AAN6KL22_9PEZI|nr:hypothetical protein LTS09_001814 [Friedmanniomyces endolithicus]KAK0314561.1 hypothetical protein LTR01_001384 [Friedmanniomyces endolithicus]KAK0326088.1 hypothetical protein LTR82_002833 [Friedmanniomyces endolithicus]KAK0827637.1 hypothetical protein LTR73_005239 [Friedmanniomyces endolithicus]KAK0925517.1 hypothetical protein LTR57_004818 [Friedmanniomyces endolithicus]